MESTAPVLSYAAPAPMDDAGVLARRRTALSRRAAVLSAMLAVPALLCVPIGVVCMGVAPTTGQVFIGLAIAVLPVMLFGLSLLAIGDHEEATQPHVPLLVVSTAGELILSLVPIVLVATSPADMPGLGWAASLYLLACAALCVSVLRDALILWRLQQQTEHTLPASELNAG